MIVSQRISTVAEADQIVVVDDGQVVGVGTHETLLANCPTYAEFADSQSLGPAWSADDAGRWRVRSAACASADPAVPRLQGLGASDCSSGSPRSAG